MQKKLLYIPALIIILSAGSCSKNISPVKTGGTIELPENSKQVIQATNRFAFDFFKEALAHDRTDKNKLISPLSIYIALSMTYNGADNDTRKAIENTLGLKNIDIRILNSVIHAILTQFPDVDNKIELSIANSIWHRKNGIQPLAGFLNTIQNDYKATIQALDFDNPASVNTINNWVSQKTNDKIPTIIDNISPDDLMYLINAIYFNGKWQQQFRKENTKNDLFYLSDGSEKNVPFMNNELTIRWEENESFTIAELPYGSGNNFSMLVLKPNDKKNETLSQLASSLNENSLTEAISSMHSSKIQIIIPKWEYDDEIENMEPELSAMGMGIAFTDDADFSKMYQTNQPVEITKAIHKTYIKVDEEGTEAAAVTTIGVGTTSVNIPERIIKLDHPFLYAIMEKQTGTILFLGVVNDPS